MAIGKAIRQAAIRFSQDESGATAIEYALLAGLIAVAMINGVKVLGSTAEGSWGKTSSKAGTAMSNNF